MIGLLLRRLLSIIPTVLGVLVVVFLLFHFVGGDPTYRVAGKNASAEQIELVRKELGLDQPLVWQFVDHLKQVATLDFGRSLVPPRERISDIVLDRMGASLSIAVPVFLITLALGLAISLLSVYWRGGRVDRLILVLCIAGVSIPSLAYILVGQYWLAYRWDWFPVAGYDGVEYIILPVLIWVVVSLGVDVRFYRTVLLNEVTQPHVLTAKAKGLSDAVIYRKHLLRNSVVPVLSYTVVQIPFLILGSLLIESFFAIPGLGSLIVDAVQNSDFPVIKGMSVIFSLLLVVFQLLTDWLYTVADPRVRLK